MVKKNSIREGGKRMTHSSYKENGNGTKLVGKSDISKETKYRKKQNIERNKNKKGRKQLLGTVTACVWLSGRARMQ